MIALGLDDTGDLDFNPDTGVFNMVSDEDEVAQKLYLILGENIGEIPWNEDIGLNHLDMIANGDNQTVIQSILEQYLQDQWPETFESVEITDFQVDGVNRLTSVSADVTLVDGTTTSAIVNEGDDNNAFND